MSWEISVWEIFIEPFDWWLIGWLIDSLIDPLIDWLADWLLDELNPFFCRVLNDCGTTASGYNVEFYFDADVSCTIKLLYFAKEEFVSHGLS